VVSAGVVDTDALAYFPNREELLANFAQRTPAGPVLTPQDVAGAVYLLCLPEGGDDQRPHARHRRRLRDFGMKVDAGIAGKIAIVTGGSRGIGRAIVELLASEGADVTFFFRDNAAAANEVVAAVKASGGKATAKQVDVRDSAACAAAAEEVNERGGRIDILVNNAGVTRDNPLAAFEDDDVARCSTPTSPASSTSRARWCPT
jgi:NAD(P)-dependent dehydrogenase (short-subunit alcohol dehydrogenase family)